MEAYAASLHALHEDPQNLDLRVEAAQHAKNGRKSGSEKNTKNDDDDEGVFAYLDQPEQQLVEASNWLSKLCLPHQKAQLEDGIGASASSAGAAFTQHSANAKVGGGGSESSSSSSSNGGSVIHGHTEDNDEPTTKTTSEAAELCAALGWKIVPTSPALGCELLGAKVAGLQGRKLGSAELAAIRAALLEYQVVLLLAVGICTTTVLFNLVGLFLTCFDASLDFLHLGRFYFVPTVRSFSSETKWDFPPRITKRSLAALAQCR